MWKEFGFRKDLYDTHPVGADDEGERLLVGREDYLRKLKNRIRHRSTVTTIEGPNGVGKTSLVFVAGHQLSKETEHDGKSSILILPKIFQIDSSESSLDFKRKVYSEIASYMLSNQEILRRRLDLQFNLNPLHNWLENPLVNSGGITAGGFGGNISRTLNTSSGFDLQGFFNIVDRLLSSAFDANGGIICMLDNLEILNTSQLARQKIEELRDDLFSAHALKWVMCGARGIVRSVANTPRLQGRLTEPLIVEPINDSAIERLISARVQEYGKSSNNIPPVGVRSFEHIYLILNSNLRDALKFSGDFALWLSDEGKYVPNSDELHDLFEIWISEICDEYENALNVPPRSWMLFDQFCEQGGAVSPSDYEEYGFNSPQSMRGAVAKLEDGELVMSEVDETDHRRKTIIVTAKGWLIHFKRSDYKRSG